MPVPILGSPDPDRSRSIVEGAGAQTREHLVLGSSAGRTARAPSPDEALRVLAELVLASSERNDLADLAGHVVDRARDLIGSDAASLFLWRDDRKLLVPIVNNDRGWNPRATRTFHPGEGVTGSAFLSRSPLIIGDYPSWSQAIDTAVSQGLKSGVAVPLEIAGEPVGVLSIRSYGHVRWTADHVRLLRILAALAGPALRAAQLRDQRPTLHLTPKEAQILGEIMSGHAAKSIARSEGISESTVRTHIRSVLAKLGVRSQVAAVAAAREMGFTPERRNGA